MTVKTLSMMIVRVIGWLVILEGIHSILSSLLLWMVRLMFSMGGDSSRYATPMTYLPVLSTIVIGLVEFGIGFAIIRNSEFFGRIFAKGIKE